MQYDYKIEDQFIPFWERNVMYNEAACFIEENGNISAKLHVHASEDSLRAGLVLKAGI